MTHEELDAAIATAHDRAHNAPLAKIGQYHTGERHILEHTNAWAKTSAEWMRLCDERERRKRLSTAKHSRSE